MSKFVLKAYNRFTRDVEAGALAVAHFLFGQPSAYIPKGDKSVTINFHWVKINVRKVLNSLLDETAMRTWQSPQITTLTLMAVRVCLNLRCVRGLMIPELMEQPYIYTVPHTPSI
jgi:hypothetical protein